MHLDFLILPKVLLPRLLNSIWFLRVRTFCNLNLHLQLVKKVPLGPYINAKRKNNSVRGAQDIKTLQEKHFDKFRFKQKKLKPTKQLFCLGTLFEKIQFIWRLLSK